MSKKLEIMSGFQKKSAKKLPTIPGTKQSLKTFQVLTSSGIPSLDSLLGGGYPLGTLILVENPIQDGSDYSKVVANHFLSHGHSLGHDVFAGNGGDRPFDQGSLVCSSSSITETKDEASETGNESKKDHMKIAWRYEDQEDTKAQFRVKTISKDPETTAGIRSGDNRVTFWTAQDLDDPFHDDSGYAQLFRRLHDASNQTDYVLENNAGKVNVIRMVMTDLDAVTMQGDDDLNGLVRFVFALKSLVRHKLAVAVISLTFSGTFTPERAYHLDKVRELCDVCLHLESFDKEKAKSLQHHGFCHVRKLPILKTLKCPIESAYGKYFFKSTRTRFTLERVHLPPELEEQGRTSTAKKDVQDW